MASKTSMRSLLPAILVVVTLAGTAACTHNGTARDAFEWLEYGPKSYGLACYFGEPTTVAEFREEADAILRVRLRGRFNEVVDFNGGTQEWSFRTATVLETIKLKADVPEPGPTSRIFEWRGYDAPRPTYVDTILGPFERFFPDTEWILFATWMPYYNAFQVINSDEGAFQIDGRIVRMRTTSEMGAEWDGKPLSVLLHELQ